MVLPLAAEDSGRLRMDQKAEAIDHARLGLDPQYSPAQQEKIRRLILEDWKKAGVKLPTYMKLVARYIAGSGLPEAWLAKLSHQTMDKMLKRISTPRYEVWACLHLYLTKKYGEPGISASAPTEENQLGRALVRFAAAEVAAGFAGTYSLPDEPDAALALEMVEAGYCRLSLVRRYLSAEPFAEPVVSTAKGVGTVKGGKLTAVLRTTSTRELESLDLALGTLAPLADPEMDARFAALRDAP